MHGPSLDPRADLARFAVLPDGRPALQRDGAKRGEERLAQWLDLGTSVLLAELVTTTPGDGAAAQLSLDALVDDGRWMREHILQQLDSLQRWLGKRQQKLYEGRNAAPSPQLIRETLEDLLADGIGSSDGHSDGIGHSERHLEALAGRWAVRVRALLRTIRRDASRIRGDVAADLRALGPAVSRLERVDAALRVGLKRRLEDQDERVAEAVARRFDERLRAMVAGAPAEDIGALVDEAFTPHGWAHGLAHEVERILRAVYQEERSLLIELIGAAQRLRADAEAAAMQPQPPRTSVAAQLAASPSSSAGSSVSNRSGESA